MIHLIIAEVEMHDSTSKRQKRMVYELTMDHFSGKVKAGKAPVMEPSPVKEPPQPEKSPDEEEGQDEATAAAVQGEEGETIWQNTETDVAEAEKGASASDAAPDSAAAAEADSAPKEANSEEEDADVPGAGRTQAQPNMLWYRCFQSLKV